MALHRQEYQHFGIGVCCTQIARKIDNRVADCFVGHLGEALVGTHRKDNQVGAEKGRLFGEAVHLVIVREACAVVADGGIYQTRLSVGRIYAV